MFAAPVAALTVRILHDFYALGVRSFPTFSAAKPDLNRFLRSETCIPSLTPKPCELGFGTSEKRGFWIGILLCKYPVFRIYGLEFEY